jgi:hypothetical protein
LRQVLQDDTTGKLGLAMPARAKTVRHFPHGGVAVGSASAAHVVSSKTSIIFVLAA